ncbi:MAG: N-acetylmannosamine-6-phosphate 2-epimerase [Halanaerobium sp.]
MNKIVKNSLIVSCQALEDEPLHGSEIMVKMAEAARVGGAKGIRANSPADVKAIREKINLPLIGLWKKEINGYPVYITPTYQAAAAVLEAGADYVAIDCTARKRPETLKEIFKHIRKNYPERGIVADISSLKDLEELRNLSPDFLSTTMSGYTKESQGRARPDLKLIEELNRETDIKILAEGHYSSGQEAKIALESGAYAVVIGSAITRPQLITHRIVSEMRS